MPKFKMDTLKNIYLDTDNVYKNYLILDYNQDLNEYQQAPGLGKLYTDQQIKQIIKQALKFSKHEFRPAY